MSEAGFPVGPEFLEFCRAMGCMGLHGGILGVIGKDRDGMG